MEAEAEDEKVNNSQVSIDIHLKINAQQKIL
jgi:hypothetical protein